MNGKIRTADPKPTVCAKEKLPVCQKQHKSEHKNAVFRTFLESAKVLVYSLIAQKHTAERVSANIITMNAENAAAAALLGMTALLRYTAGKEGKVPSTIASVEPTVVSSSTSHSQGSVAATKAIAKRTSTGSVDEKKKKKRRKKVHCIEPAFPVQPRIVQVCKMPKTHVDQYVTFLSFAFVPGLLNERLISLLSSRLVSPQQLVPRLFLSAARARLRLAYQHSGDVFFSKATSHIVDARVLTSNQLDSARALLSHHFSQTLGTAQDFGSLFWAQPVLDFFESVAKPRTQDVVEDERMLLS